MNKPAYPRWVDSFGVSESGLLRQIKTLGSFYRCFVGAGCG